MRIAAGPIETDQDLAVAHSIRLEVFVMEQSVPEDLELDGLDEQSAHYMAWRNGEPVATARLRRVEAGGYKLERVAVRSEARGLGVGTHLVRCVLSSLPENVAVVVHAQVEALSFWVRMGFDVHGNAFDEGGIAHHRMVRRLP